MGGRKRENTLSMQSEPCKPQAGSLQDDRPKAPPCGRAIRWLYRRIRGLLALGMLAILLLVFTPAGTWLEEALDVTRPPQPADYIVCLGGDDDRLIWAAELFRQGLAPKVIVTNFGGAARAMASRIEQMGVPSDRLLVEMQSKTTGDHPSAIAALPGVDRENQRFLIVTSRRHSRRAAACFRHEGYRHVTVYAGRACSQMGGPLPAAAWRERIIQLPQIGYEYAALVKYRLQGRI